MREKKGGETVRGGGVFFYLLSFFLVNGCWFVVVAFTRAPLLLFPPKKGAENMISSILGKRGERSFYINSKIEPFIVGRGAAEMNDMSTDNRQENEKAKKVLSRLRGDITLLIHTKNELIHKLIHTFLDESQIMF